MANTLVQICVTCQRHFEAPEVGVDTCSRACYKTASQAIKRGHRQKLSQTEFAATFKAQERDYWRHKLREFRLAHHLRGREMSILLGYKGQGSSTIQQIESGKRELNHIRRMMLQALIDGYRPFDKWPKGKRTPHKQVLSEVLP